MAGRLSRIPGPSHNACVKIVHLKLIEDFHIGFEKHMESLAVNLGIQSTGDIGFIIIQRFAAQFPNTIQVRPGRVKRGKTTTCSPVFFFTFAYANRKYLLGPTEMKFPNLLIYWSSAYVALNQAKDDTNTPVSYFPTLISAVHFCTSIIYSSYIGVGDGYIGCVCLGLG